MRIHSLVLTVTLLALLIGCEKPIRDVRAAPVTPASPDAPRQMSVA